MEDWKEMKEEAQKIFKDNKFHLACHKYIAAFEQLTSGKTYDKTEAAKLLSNISLMYLKMYQQENDVVNSEWLLNSRLYADRAINEIPSWHKGYLRLAECYCIDKNFEKVLDTLKSYLNISEDNEIPDEFQNYLTSVKYYTHNHVLEKKDIWKFVTYPDNVFVIDQKGAGHFESLDSLMRYTGFILKELSIIVRPGIYVGTYMFGESTFEIIGDWRSKVQFDNDAIKDKPSIVFTNTACAMTLESFAKNSSGMLIMPNTFRLKKCDVTMRNICIEENVIHHPIHAINAKNSIINIHSSSFYSKFSAAVTFDFSTVNIENCQSIGAYSALLSSFDSTCTMRNCYVSNTVGVGIEIRDDSKILRLHSCIIKDCQKQGVCAYNGAKSIQIKSCTFSNNATHLSRSPGSIQLRECKAIIKDTIICDQKNSVGIVIEYGWGKFENLQLSNCLTGVLVQAPVFIKSCIFRKCLMAVNLCEVIKGTVEFEDNSMLDCRGEIGRSSKSPQVTFHGSKTHLVINVDSAPFIKKMSASKLWKKYNAERNVDNEFNMGPVGEVLNLNKKRVIPCEFCGLSSFLTGRPLQFCSRCKISLYCSSDCQHKAWKSHKPFCNRYIEAKGKTSTSVNLIECANDETLKVETQAEKSTNIPEWKRKNKKKQKRKPAF